MSDRCAMTIAVAAAAGGRTGGGVGVVRPSAAAVATAPRPAWTEVAWPFPMDQWGKGKAFRCKAADCGAEVNVYLRAKLGFCNCTTGVADDDDLDRMGDLDLVGEASPLGAGRPISVAWMKGRSRAYMSWTPAAGLRKTVISVAFNERCDMIVATAVLGHDRPAAVEPGVIDVPQRQHGDALGRGDARPLVRVAHGWRGSLIRRSRGWRRAALSTARRARCSEECSPRISP